MREQDEESNGEYAHQKKVRTRSSRRSVSTCVICISSFLYLVNDVVNI